MLDKTILFFYAGPSLLFFDSCTKGVLSLLRSAPRSGVAFVLARVQDARKREISWQLVSRTHKNVFLARCALLNYFLIKLSLRHPDAHCVCINPQGQVHFHLGTSVCGLKMLG